MQTTKHGAFMERPAVATGGNRSQMGVRRERLRQAKTVAVGCDRLPKTFHGKEGVDGSSPSEGSAKAPHVGAFRFGSVCRSSNVGQVWSPLWSLQVENARGGSAIAAASTDVLGAFARSRACAEHEPRPRTRLDQQVECFKNRWQV